VARLFADANFPWPTVNRLRRLGHDVMAVQQVEGTSRPEKAMTDEDLLAYAVAHRRAVPTLNATHFERLHRDKPDHKGIIVCKSNLDFRKQAKQVDAAIKENTPLRGKLIHVPPIGEESED
jgi:hypothetical protein